MGLLIYLFPFWLEIQDVSSVALQEENKTKKAPHEPHSYPVQINRFLIYSSKLK